MAENIANLIATWCPLPQQEVLLEKLMTRLIDKEGSLFLLSGSSQSGKSRLLRELSIRISTDKAIRFGIVSGGSDQLVPKLFKALDESKEMLLLSFKERLALLVRQKRLVGESLVLAVDDAELLPFDLLVGLVATAEEFPKDFALILSYRHDKQGELVENLLQSGEDFLIEPLDLSSMQLFIAHYQKIFKVDKTFTQKELNELQHITYGYPGRILTYLGWDRLPQRREQRDQLLYLLIGSTIFILLLLSGVKWLGKEKEDIDSLEPLEMTDVVEAVIESTPSLGERLSVQEKIARIDTGYSLSHLRAEEYERLYIEAAKRNGRPIEVRQLVVNQVPIREVALSKAEISDEYYIELARAEEQAELEEILEGRSIPSSLKTVRIGAEWVAIIGPYQNQAEAEEGREQLPASLKMLDLKILNERHLTR